MRETQHAVKPPELHTPFWRRHTASGGRSMSRGCRRAPWCDRLSWLCISTQAALSSETTAQGLRKCRRPQSVFDDVWCLIHRESHKRVVQAFGMLFSSRPVLINLHHPGMSLLLTASLLAACIAVSGSTKPGAAFGTNIQQVELRT